LGTALAADAMAQTVIEPTDVSRAVFESIIGEAQLLENNDFTVEADGYYYFGIHAISDMNKYYLYVDNFTVELGATSVSPAAVTDLTVTQVPGELAANVSFKAPSVTVAGDPITENLTNIDIYRDGSVVKSITDIAPGSQQNLLDSEGLTRGLHSYYVVANNAVSAGAKSDTVDVLIAQAQDVPVLYDFTRDFTKEALVINANGDDRSWSWSATDGAVYVFGLVDADEYLVLQPVRLTAGVNYSVTVSACSMGEDSPERVEVLMGKTATVAGLDVSVLPTTVVATESGQYQDYVTEFAMDESGEYFVALRCTSTNRDGFRLKVKKLLVSKAAATDAPAAPAITVQNDPDGKTEAIIKVTAPMLCIDSTALTAKMPKLDILRDDHVIYTATDVEPGQVVNFIDSTATKGVHAYHAMAYDANGDPGEASDKVTLYVGQDLPKALYDMRYADNGDGYTFMWDKVDSIGRNDGYVNPALVDYVVSANKVSEIAGVEYDDVGEELGRVRDGDRFTITGLNTDEGEQRMVPYYVRTENVAGATKDYQKFIIIGAPYVLPFVENFADRTLHSLWNYGDGTAPGVGADASDGDGSCLQLGPSGTYGVVEFETGKIDFSITHNPVLTFDLKRGNTVENDFNVYAVLPDGSRTDLQTVPITDNYTTHTVSLNNEALRTARFARIGFTVDFAFPAYGHYVILDNVKIEDVRSSGDVDGDGKVDVADVNAAINIILKTKTVADYPGSADLDGDGKVDVADVNAIINLILKV
ncbi:MAG: dockerin type I repeat-containing protein, partial [Muribaculaceae bacterium]|nr:dockerin type I repeat-containing protein [Muribaculaceae bacterium]